MDAVDRRHEGNVGDEAAQPGLAAEPPGGEAGGDDDGAGRRTGEQRSERRGDATATGTT